MNVQRNLLPIPSLAIRLGAAMLAALFLLGTVSPAMAAGRVVWKKTTIDENPKRGSWRIDLKIFMPRAPDVAYVPMKFEFEPVARYERSLVDGKDGPVERTVPLRGQQALIETVDVGFMDAGSGQTLPRTKFTFKITRAHDFKAGEYKVKIKDARNGRQVGTTTRLKLKGENPVVDRRSVVFHGKDDDDDDEEKEEVAEESEDSAEPASGDFEDEGFDEGPPPAEEGDTPPAIEEKPGGGCHHGPPHDSNWAWLVVAALLSAGWLARRRSL